MLAEVENTAYADDDLESAYHIYEEDPPLEPLAMLTAIACCYAAVAIYMCAS